MIKYEVPKDHRDACLNFEYVKVSKEVWKEWIETLIREGNEPSEIQREGSEVSQWQQSFNGITCGLAHYFKGGSLPEYLISVRKKEYENGKEE